MRSLHRTPVAVSDCYAPRSGSGILRLGHPCSGFVIRFRCPAVHGHAPRASFDGTTGVRARGPGCARGPVEAVAVHTWNGINPDRIMVPGIRFQTACGLRDARPRAHQAGNVDFDIVDCSRTPRPASRACAKRARSPSRDTQTQRTVLPVRTNVIAVIPKIRSCDERARTCCSMGGGPMIADRSHSTSRVTVRGPAQSRTHGQDLGHGQALLSDPPNGTDLHTALHTHDPTRSHSCTCPEWRGSQCYFKGYGEAEAAVQRARGASAAAAYRGKQRPAKTTPCERN